MTSLYLAWQNPVKGRAWYPIGRLDAESAQGPYRFSYIRGAEKARRVAGLNALPSFPDFEKHYESERLFPLFRNRILSSEREDFDEYLRNLDLDASTADPLVILAITGGHRQTDTFEVFPKIARNADGTFRCRYFLHGLRHLGDRNRERTLALKAGDSLRVSIELNNPATGLALQLHSQEYDMLGWAPRYLVIDLVRVIQDSYHDIKAHVVKMNPEAIPQQRVLVELSGNWPENFEPMSSDDFRDLNPAEPIAG